MLSKYLLRRFFEILLFRGCKFEKLNEILQIWLRYDYEIWYVCNDTIFDKCHRNVSFKATISKFGMRITHI